MPSHRNPKRAPGRHWFVVIVAAIAGLAGCFGPWIPHRAVGLVVTGLDLGEYVKFIPQMMAGQIALRREIFYLPLLVGALTAALIASRRSLPGWVRALAGLAAIPLALAMLPPAWSPGTLLQPEFRLQAIAIAICLAMLPAILITRYLPDPLVLMLVALLAVAAAIAPAWGFWQIRPAIEALYRHPLPLGWGFWAGLAGFLLLAFFAAAGIFVRSRRSD
jgi:hypothetical protein